MGSTKEEFLAALKKAKEANDLEAVEDISEVYKERFGEESPDIFTEEVENESSGESFAAGAAQGLTAGASDELGAAMETAATELPQSVVADDPRFMDAEDMQNQLNAQNISGLPQTLSGLTTVYEKNLQDERKYLEKARKDNPWWYLAGDVAGTVGSFAIGAGEANLAKSIAIGGVNGLMRSERKTLSEAAQDAAIGGAFSLMGEGVGAGIKKVGSGIRETTKSWSAGSVLNALGVGGKLQRRDFRNHLVKTSKYGNMRSKEEFADDLFNMEVDGEPLFTASQNFVETLDKVVRKTDEIGDNIQAILGQADKQLGKNIKPKEIYRELRRDFVEPLLMQGKVQEPAHRETGNALKKYLDDLFVEIVPEETIENIPRQINTGVMDETGQPIMKTVMETKTVVKNTPKFRDNITLKELNRLKNKIYHAVKNTGDITPSGQGVGETSLLLKAQKEKVGSRITAMINEVVESELADDGLYAAYRKLKMQDEDLFLAQRHLIDKIDTLDAGLIGRLKQTVRGSGWMIAGGARQAGVNNAASLGLVASFNQFVNSGSAPAALAVSLKNISNFMGRKPEIGGNMAAKLISASSQSVKAFSNALASAESEIFLSENPMPRTTEAAMKQAHHLIPLIKDKMPDMANKLLKAMNNGDQKSLASIMATLSEDPNGAQFVQPGLGWDGMAVTANDIKQVKAWIGAIPSIKKKMYLTKEFDASQKIPEEMIAGGDGKEPMKQILYKKVKDKMKKAY